MLQVSSNTYLAARVARGFQAESKGSQNLLEQIHICGVSLMFVAACICHLTIYFDELLTTLFSILDANESS